ncbi:hypothetical protein [Gallibacterium anatis]|uniref:hypothetical protein n=1 Tax=Gallibacterium anatis TaxID=750 RepID=UPI000531324F|nr:hypothetical protein [Gallibacterium anatis]KGQ44463.1 hypothetical protein JP29_08905 [Gallibacterium anatis]
MLTKSDFLRVIEATSMKYPLMAALFHAGDPRYFQIQESMAEMLSMFSQQLEVSSQEPFVKSREATVLADAAAKGLLFTASSAEMVLKVTNNSEDTIYLGVGRVLLDSNGRYYKVIKPLTIKGKQEGELAVIQETTDTQTVYIDNPEPFMSIEVEQPKDGSYITGITVSIDDEVYLPSYRYNGVQAGEKVFHVESDEFKRLFIKFGMRGVIGVEPPLNSTVKIVKNMSFGNVLPETESPFTLEYIQKDNENNLKFEMKSLTKSGVNSVSLATLKELCKFPSVYDDNAVYLGEFNRLVKAHFGDLPFLNVWNEQKEELARGANIDNVNTLFYSFKKATNDLRSDEAIKNEIEHIIKQADDSYKIKFIAPVIKKIPVTVKATISRLYDEDTVRQQVYDVLISTFGESSIGKVGRAHLRNKVIADLLLKNINAIADQRSDLDVTFTLPDANKPEVFCFMDNGSINVTVETSEYASDVWGGLGNG